jgi:hypothetical protein
VNIPVRLLGFRRAQQKDSRSSWQFLKEKLVVFWRESE